MAKETDWTRERLEALDDIKLKNLTENAAKAGYEDLVLLCKEVLSVRGVKSFRVNKRHARKRNDAKGLANEISEKMGLFATELAKKFDLSKKTARIKSASEKGFIPHALVDSRGRAKTGGAEKAKKLQFDRLLSYRLGNITVTLTVFLLLQDNIENIRFQINAPEEYLPDGVSFDDSGRKGLYEPRFGTDIYRFKNFSSLEEALDGYSILVQKLQGDFDIEPLALN